MPCQSERDVFRHSEGWCLVTAPFPHCYITCRGSTGPAQIIRLLPWPLVLKKFLYLYEQKLKAGLKVVKWRQASGLFWVALKTSGIDLVPWGIMGFFWGFACVWKKSGHCTRACAAPRALLTTCFVPCASRHCTARWPSVLLQECFPWEFTPAAYLSKNLRGEPFILPLTNSSTKSVTEILFETFLSGCFAVGKYILSAS